MPSRLRVDEFIAIVESGDHVGAVERAVHDPCSMKG
jgi:hypothetical protein